MKLRKSSFSKVYNADSQTDLKSARIMKDGKKKCILKLYNVGTQKSAFKNSSSSNKKFEFTTPNDCHENIKI